MFVKINHSVQLEYADVGIYIKTFAANPGYWQICVEYFLPRSASVPDGDGMITGLTLADMKMICLSRTPGRARQSRVSEVDLSQPRHKTAFW